MPRAISPVVGTVLLIAITVGLAATAGLVVFGDASAEQPPQASISASADPTTDRITLTHHGGDTLSTEELTVRVTVDGEPLTHQPPMPFFASKGFASGPTGPFNPAADPGWSAGERASFELASTNAPLIDPDSTVTVTVSTDDSVIAELETEAG